MGLSRYYYRDSGSDIHVVLNGVTTSVVGIINANVAHCFLTMSRTLSQSGKMLPVIKKHCIYCVKHILVPNPSEEYTIQINFMLNLFAPSIVPYNFKEILYNPFHTILYMQYIQDPMYFFM